jgi:hypothetical protein
MPMAPFVHIDFGSRVSALRSVGTALVVGNANMPAQNAANSGPTHLYYINLMRVQQALPALPSLDYSGFQAAVNVLAARVL